MHKGLKQSKPDAGRLKAQLATEIVNALDRERLTLRAAHLLTGIAAADFSRIRNADFGRFTIDRLMSIVHKLGCQIEITVIGRKDAQHVEPVKRSISA